MQEKVVSLDKRFEKEYEFILNGVIGDGVLYGDIERGDRRELYVGFSEEGRDRYFISLCEEVLLTAFKWRYFEPYVKGCMNTPTDKALIFSLLDFDSSSERGFFRDKIYPHNALHLDALYNFGIKNVKKVWDGYVELIMDFYSHSPGMEEKCELTAYMTSVNKRCKRVREARYYLFEEKESKILQNLFYYHEKGKVVGEELGDCAKIVKKIFG
ncbi:MAG: hypothetical protein IJF76_01700 [Clostridia bacterium]|nr:hypothetical protein [Clostridia bacterium]